MDGDVSAQSMLDGIHSETLQNVSNIPLVGIGSIPIHGSLLSAPRIGTLQK